MFLHRVDVLNDLSKELQLVWFSKANILHVLVAHIEAVFLDQTMPVWADPASARTFTEFSQMAPVELLVIHVAFFTAMRQKAHIFFKLSTLSCSQLPVTYHFKVHPFPSPGDLPNPETEPRSPALQADSLPAEPPGKPKNTGVGSLSLLQWIFSTQESNQGLLHCRQILYQLSYQRSPELLYRYWKRSYMLNTTYFII